MSNGSTLALVYDLKGPGLEIHYAPQEGTLDVSTGGLWDAFDTRHFTGDAITTTPFVEAQMGQLVTVGLIPETRTGMRMSLTLLLPVGASDSATGAAIVTQEQDIDGRGNVVVRRYEIRTLAGAVSVVE